MCGVLVSRVVVHYMWLQMLQWLPCPYWPVSVLIRVWCWCERVLLNRGGPNVKWAMVVDIRTWVKNVVNQPPSVVTDILVPLVPPTMSAKAVLICRPNSHPFQERTLILEQPVKVGRSVARARATPTNAIFDCKVLSRHHALLWYENGKFYLQVIVYIKKLQCI